MTAFQRDKSNPSDYHFIDTGVAIIKKPTINVLNKFGHKI